MAEKKSLTQKISAAARSGKTKVSFGKAMLGKKNPHHGGKHKSIGDHKGYTMEMPKERKGRGAKKREGKREERETAKRVNGRFAGGHKAIGAQDGYTMDGE